VPDWFVVNVADAPWFTHEKFGATCFFERAVADAEFPDLVVNIRVLAPGQPNGIYHAEGDQEDFLVLGGECTLVVEGEERALRTWDFFHCPQGTAHIVVGAGDGPSVVLMMSSRKREGIHYPVDETAARYGASVEVATDSAQEAYAGLERPQPGRPDTWEHLPWA